MINLGQAFDGRGRGGGFGGDNFAEMMAQARRDQLLNEARGLAFQAGDALQRTYDTFPMEARSRYPQLTAGIGRAPIPNLKGANFLGE